MPKRRVWRVFRALPQSVMEPRGYGVKETGEEAGESEKESFEPSMSSMGEDLTGDLEDVLSNDFNFQGKFAFGTSLPTAPNPGLQVRPLGLISLPLGKTDAQNLKDIASQAPFGHGERLVVDTSVRHTWEIEPANVITFANPAWKSFMHSTIETVCTELGVSPCSNPPRCELYKLLLYETGSHFLPHQDTEKAPGMFATIVIVLPSLYSGGQICVSHGSENQVFDFSASSSFETTLLAWYADVTHEVKPITSGYRLALSYNLIHEATSSPLPSIPSTNSSALKLKHIFHKWSKRSYSDAPQTIAYILKHQYSKIDLSMGEKALKGADAHLIGVLRHLAGEEGVKVGLAELECHIVGYAGEPHGYVNKRARYDPCEEGDDDEEEEEEEEDEDMFDDEFDDTPTMGEEMERSTKLSSVVDLDGKELIGNDSIAIGKEDFIPSNLFVDEGPDDEDYSGYMGNEPGNVEYWYHRTALVLFLEEDTQGVLLEAGGNNYAIAQLKLHDSHLPSAQDLEFSNYVAEHLAANDKKQALYILDLALRWRDAGLWLKVARKCGADKNPRALGDDKLSAAWDTFGFNTLRPLLEQAVAHCTTLKIQIEFINSILLLAKTEDDRSKVSIWCNNQRDFALAHLKEPSKEDIPIIVEALKAKGMIFFVEITNSSIQPQLARQQSTLSTFDFLANFVKAVQTDKAELELSAPISSHTTFEQIVDFCLSLAVKQWKQLESSRYSFASYGRPEQQLKGQGIDRIIRLAELCILTEQMVPCERLFTSLIEHASDLDTKFRDYYTLLVPKLCRLFNSRNIPLNVQPFADFFRYLIETYLVSELGMKSGEMRHNAIRKVGCGCVDCRKLDNFLFSLEPRREFRLAQMRRTHLEQRLYSASDIVSFTTIRNSSPHGLQVTKHADVVAAASWKGRQKAVKQFLTSFGGDAAVKLLKDARFSDIAKAISGEKAYIEVTKPFVSSTYTTTAPARKITSLKPIDLTTGGVASVAAGPPSASFSQALQRTNIVAGMKRKNLGFVDLTGSP